MKLNQKLSECGLRIVQSVDFVRGGYVYSVTGSERLAKNQHFKTYPTPQEATDAAFLHFDGTVSGNTP